LVLIRYIGCGPPQQSSESKIDQKIGKNIIVDFHDEDGSELSEEPIGGSICLSDVVYTNLLLTGADVGCRIQRKSDFRILLFTLTLYKLQDTELLTYPHHCSRPMLLKSQRLKIFTV
jgi:hypothetical protein